MLSSKRSIWLGLFLVVLSGVVLTYNLPNRLDITATDDDMYFENGLKAMYQGQPLPIQMAPLFSLWYLLVNAFTNSVISTYYTNWLLLSILPGVLFFFLLRSLHLTTLVSVAVSVLYLFSPLNFPLDLKVSAFTMSWLLGGLILSNYQVDPVRKFTAAAAGALLATYGRPEFFLSFLILCVLALSTYLWQRRTRPQPWPYPLLGLMGLAAVLVVAFGSPLSGQRSIIAFAQHFAMNYTTWHPEIIASPWMHSKLFMVHAFGREVTSLGDAFLLNPALFLRHIGTNVVNLFTHTVHFLVGTFFTPWLSMLEFPGRRYLLLAMAIAVVGLANWPQTVKNLWLLLRQNGWYWVCVLAAVAPTFISCILLFPRDHYVVFQMMLYVSLIGVVLGAYTLRPLPAMLQTALPYAALLALGAFLWPNWRVANQTKPTPVADMIRAINQLAIPGPVNITGNVTLMYRLYFRPDWTFYYLEQYKPTSIETFVEQYRINCLHIRPDVVEKYQTDPFFNQLLAKPEAFGFTRHAINVPDQYVLVRQQAVSLTHSSLIH